VALVGSGEYLEVMVDVDRSLLAGRPPRAVLIPTAAAEEGEERVRYWLDLGGRHFERLGVEPVPLPVLTREDASREELAALVTGAGLVYLSGGNPGYLAAALRGTLVWQAIVTTWRGGAALAGCSAGACALSYAAEDVRAARAARAAGSGASGTESPWHEPSGLAVIPEVAVIPHYDRMSQWVPDFADRYLAQLPPEVTVVGVDEDTAIVTAGDAPEGLRKFTVAGRQSAWVIDPGGQRTEYPSGSTLSVPQRR
jgi:cyanophycinase